ncbi:MAG: tRNA (guanine-N2)-dimethyltransferase [Candidatus Bathyarchaeota archaeon B26-1]|nr:MAG: tRNA (guanine-N2)-dimethyltransferase [Candidatus Bathyarchaeota archaeon B26-1]
MATLFFLLSGENPTLPSSEARAILEAEGFRYDVLEELTQLLRVEADPECVRRISSRSSLVRVCGLELFNCEADLGVILEEAGRTVFDPLIGEGETFAVRVRRVRGASPALSCMTLERKIGERILKRVSGAKVDLKEPEKTFFGILTDRRFVFGLKLAEIKPKEFVERSPRRRAFFHPVAMPAKLARCMVNLAQPRRGEVVLDPFCGTGSILLEAGLIGCRVLGFDVKRRMVEGTLRNLARYGVNPVGVLVGDARRLPLISCKVDCVVTDPPYGVSATTLRLDPLVVYESFLSSIVDHLKRGRRICLAAPKTLRISEVGVALGLRHVESHFIYVHRRLTREVAVFERA